MSPLWLGSATGPAVSLPRRLGSLFLAARRAFASSTMSSSAPLVAPRDLAAWRSWLASNHATSRGAWLVTHKKTSGRQEFDRRDAVKAGLAYGWVDSLPRAVDDARTSFFFSPRKPKSGWSAVNKVLVAELEAEGGMAEPGRAAVARAKESGAWAKLDASEALKVPADLAAALAARGTGARAHWDSFPPSNRKGVLQWISLAVRPETRAARVEQVARDAAAGVRSLSTQGKRAAPKRHAEGTAVVAVAGEGEEEGGAAAGGAGAAAGGEAARAGGKRARAKKDAARGAAADAGGGEGAAPAPAAKRERAR